MDGVDGGRRTRMTLKERLGLKGLGCCAATWGFRPTTISVRDDPEEEEAPYALEAEDHQLVNADQSPRENLSDPSCLGPVLNPAVSSMNLATALAAERQFREGSASTLPINGDMDQPTTTNYSSMVPGTPTRVSLMRLLEETDGPDIDLKIGGGETAGSETMCCVCMTRKKGAAFIPCGHTFCRVCSRELWLNRGSCPLCNRSVLEILDIF